MKHKKLFFILMLCVACFLASLAFGAWYNTTPQHKMTETVGAGLNETATDQARSRAIEAALPTATLSWTASPAATLTIRSVATVAIKTVAPTKLTATGTATRSPVTWTPRSVSTWTPRPVPTSAPIATLPSPPASSRCPAGAMAICCDGTTSFSASRRGTCSHHGGVCRWCP